LIQRAYEREGFISALVFGTQGVGKTSYALHVAKEIYGDWKKALDHLFFNPVDAIDCLDRALEKGYRIPLIIMDDAGLWLGKSQWWEDGKVEFAEFFDIIRSICSSVIFTTPSDNLMSRLSKEIMLRIKVHYIDSDLYEELKQNGFEDIDVETWRVAKIYRFSLSPLFQPLIQKFAYDVYPVRYPEDIKKEYEKKRLDAIRHKLKRVKESLKKSLESSNPKKEMDDLDKKILELLEKGYTKTEVAKMLGVCRATVYNRLKRLRALNN
jgi:DNA polymerase III delta prime subunit